MTKLGIDCKIFINTATYASPTWAEVKSVNDWKESAGWGTADANDRSTILDGVVKTTKQLGWSGTVKRDGTAGANKIAEAFLYRDPVDVLILDGPIDKEGTEGWRLDAHVLKRDYDGGRQTRLYDEIDIKPAGDAVNKPKRATVGESGPPTYVDVTGIKPA
jgi:hypothetical protein